LVVKAANLEDAFTILFLVVKLFISQPTAIHERDADAGLEWDYDDKGCRWHSLCSLYAMRSWQS